MPAFAIIDTHVHLFDPARLRYGWLAGAAEINRPHSIADFDAATMGTAIEGFVFVEVAADPGEHLREAAMVQAVASANPRLRAIVAHAPVEKGAAIQADLEALLRHENLRGIRRLIQGEVDPSICIAPDFVEGVRRAGRHGLSFDICIRHWAMGYAIELAKKCPDVTFVLDHIGKPDIRNSLREPWWGQISEMARLPNITCKISGAIGEADPANWTPEQVKPYVAHAIDCFGFERCMFGSDWPVSALTHTYRQWIDLVDAVIAGSSEAEKRLLYCDTARRVYRI